MALHHNHYGFWYFFRCYKSNSLSWHTSNFESANKKPSFIRVASCVFPDVILVSNYHSYKGKTIKLLPYHSFYGDQVSPKKMLTPCSDSTPQENTKPPGSPFSSIPLKKFKLHLS